MYMKLLSLLFYSELLSKFEEFWDLDIYNEIWHLQAASFVHLHVCCIYVVLVFCSTLPEAHDTVVISSELLFLSYCYLLSAVICVLLINWFIFCYSTSLYNYMMQGPINTGINLQRTLYITMGPYPFTSLI